MAVSADVLFTALEDYSPKLEETFFVQHPLFKAIFEQKQVDVHALEGTERTFGVYTGGPGTVTKIVNGSEVITGGRNDIGHKGREAPTRAIYAFDVPNKDLDRANGKMDIVKLLEKYPEAAVSDLQMKVAQQLARGDGDAGINGIVTMNGAATYTPETTSKTGVFSYADKASQTSTVFGLVKEGGASGVFGWYNQYADISAFDTDGLKQLRSVLFAAARQGKNQGNGLDLAFADEGSYLNLLEKYSQFVKLPTAIDNDVVDKKVKEFVYFHQVKMFLEIDIDITADAFAETPAAGGLIYFINSGTWELFHASNNPHDSKGKPNMFRYRNPFRHPTQDMMRFEIISDMNLVCNNLRANGCVTGGAV